MEVALLLTVVFLALVGFAMLFIRNSPAQPPVAPTAPVSDVVPNEPEEQGPREDATGEPASTRDQANRPTDVFTAAATGHVLALKDLLDANPHVSRVEQLDERGWTALHHASYNGHLPCVRLLIQKNAHVDAVAEGECVPLHMAAAHGSVECVTALLTAGADANLPDEAGSTALHYAAQPGRLDVVRALVGAGAVVNMKNGRRETPLDLAVRLEDDAVAIALREAKARPGSEVRMADVLPELGDSPAARSVPTNWHLDGEGPELEAAYDAARAAMPRFLMHLADHPDARAAVKFARREGTLTEFLWGEVVEAGQPLQVRLSAPPVAVTVPDGLIEVSYADVVDWQVRLEGRTTAGGYSQRATYASIKDEYGFLPPTIQDELDRLVDI
jgi:hypothetical protein